MKSNLYRREKWWAKADREERASLTPRLRLQEWMPSPLRHALWVSYLLICWRQKGFLLFRNWTLGARWVSHTKLPCCQRYFFSLGFLLLLFGFLPRRVKGRTVDSAGAKGGIRDSTGGLQSSLQKMLYFKALSFANPSSSPVSIKLEGGGE